MDTPTTYAEALRHARNEAGLTQKELGRRIGRSGRTVQDWERGIRTPTGYLSELEDALGKPPGWFSAQVNVLERLLAIEGTTQEAIEIHRQNAQTLKDILAVLRLMISQGSTVITLCAGAAGVLLIEGCLQIATGAYYAPQTLRAIGVWITVTLGL